MKVAQGYSTTITGTGSAVPPRVVTNEELAKSVATTDQWVRNRLGIAQRHVADPGIATSDLAVEAAAQALAMAGRTVHDVDLIIVATATPDYSAPSTACIVANKLGVSGIPAFDISAVCSGFLYGVITAHQFIATGACTRVLLIGADTFSKITDWTDRSCVFFGDGAGAAVLEQCEPGKGLLAMRFHADGSGYRGFIVPAGGSARPATDVTVMKREHYYRMDARAVFDIAVTKVPEAITGVLEDADLAVSDVDHLVPHQASLGVLKECSRILGLPMEKVATSLEGYGNTAGATIPLTLDLLNRRGGLADGQLVAFASMAAGWTWGAALLRWGR